MDVVVWCGSYPVTLAPARAIQYAVVGPAIEAPTMRTFRPDIWSGFGWLCRGWRYVYAMFLDLRL